MMYAGNRTVQRCPLKTVWCLLQSKAGVCPRSQPIWHLFFLRAFPDPGGVLLHTRCDGSFFSLARLRARTRVKCVLVHELLYPDDAAFMAHTEQEIQEMCNSFATACTEFGLTISLSKTESVRHSCPPHVTINGTVLSVVEKFVYLGSTLKANNSLDAELNTRIGRASTTFGRLQSRFWNNSHLSLKAKVHVYKFLCALRSAIWKRNVAYIPTGRAQA